MSCPKTDQLKFEVCTAVLLQKTEQPAICHSILDAINYHDSFSFLPLSTTAYHYRTHITRLVNTFPTKSPTIFVNFFSPSSSLNLCYPINCGVSSANLNMLCCREVVYLLQVWYKSI